MNNTIRQRDGKTPDIHEEPMSIYGDAEAAGAHGDEKIAGENRSEDENPGTAKGRSVALWSMLSFTAIFLFFVLFGFLVLKCTN